MGDVVMRFAAVFFFLQARQQVQKLTVLVLGQWVQALTQG
jgi:hypothetical protein